LTPLALDTSVAVPLLVASHRDHVAVVRWWDRREIALSGHALAETYSVLTRLPGDARVAPADAARLIRARFTAPLTLAHETFGRLPDLLSSLGIAGGAVYDALVALAAIEHDAELATRDARAKATYEVLGARVTIAG
jgi:predicted nucleic acid-binding protein